MQIDTAGTQFDLAAERNRPRIDVSVWVAPNATVVGRVTVGARSSVWYGAVLRADTDDIRVGLDTNIQDGAVIHADAGFPVKLGDRVTVGHRAVVHGCTVGSDVLIGMGAILMNGATVGDGSIVAAGTVVVERMQVPPGSLIAGTPGRIRRQLTEDEHSAIAQNAANYRFLAERHAALIGSTRFAPTDAIDPSRI